MCKELKATFLLLFIRKHLEIRQHSISKDRKYSCSKDPFSGENQTNIKATVSKVPLVMCMTEWEWGQLSWKLMKCKMSCGLSGEDQRPKRFYVTWHMDKKDFLFVQENKRL